MRLEFLTLCVCLLLILPAELSAQTVTKDIVGTSSGARTGTVVRDGKLYTSGTFGGCIHYTYLAAGAPGWSGNTGRVELWKTSVATP